MLFRQFTDLSALLLCPYVIPAQDKVFALLMEYLIKFVDMKEEDLKESFPRGVLSSDCAADASLMYRKR